MTKSKLTETEQFILSLADRYQVRYVETETDIMAHHMSRLADNTVVLDDVEKMLIALQRAGHVSRAELVCLQAQYLREARL
jgi:hypothetical protein